MRRTLAVLLFVPIISSALSVEAQASPDVDGPAPSLALDTDPAPPLPRLTLVTDLAAVALGAYTLRLEHLLAPAHGGWLSVTWLPGEGERALAFEVGYHMWPLGHGADGPFLGPSVAVALAGQGHDAVATLGLEAGYQVVWGAVALAAAGGVNWAAGGFMPRVLVALGYAWM